MLQMQDADENLKSRVSLNKLTNKQGCILDVQNIVQYCLTNKLTDKQACNPDVSAQTSFPLQVCAKFQSLDLEILNQINLTKILLNSCTPAEKNYDIIWDFFPKMWVMDTFAGVWVPDPSLASNVYPQKFQILAGWINVWHTNKAQAKIKHEGDNLTKSDRTLTKTLLLPADH